MEGEEVIRKTLYEFKQFARKGGFWEEYKRMSKPLNKIRPKKTFIEVIGMCEPVELIQSGEHFSGWPSGTWDKWHDRSEKWAKICLEKGLFFDKHDAKRYVRTFISKDLVENLK